MNKTNNNNIQKTPASGFFIVRTNLMMGTTGDSYYVSIPSNENTGMTPNWTIDVITREIRNKDIGVQTEAAG